MNEISLESLQRQLDQLATANRQLAHAHRRLKRIGGAVLVGAVLLAVGGAVRLRQAEKLTISELTVQDNQGRDRIWLGTAAGDGMPMLHFRDEQGLTRLEVQLSIGGAAYIGCRDLQEKTRLLMSASTDGSPYLSLYDEHGPFQPRLDLSVSKDGGPSIGFYDRGKPADKGELAPPHDLPPRLEIGMATQHKEPLIQFNDAQGKGRLLMDQAGDGSCALTLFDQDEEGRLNLGLTKQGMPGLHLADAQGKRRAAMGMTAEGKVGLDIMNKSENVRFAVSVNGEGVPDLSLYDSNGKHRTGLSMENDHPYLVLKDEKEHQLVDLGVNPEKGSGLLLRDAQDRSRGSFRMTPDGDVKVHILDADGQTVFQAPAP